MRLGYVFVSQNRYKILKSCLKLNLTWFWCEQVPTRPENNGLKRVTCSIETKPASSVSSKNTRYVNWIEPLIFVSSIWFAWDWDGHSPHGKPSRHGKRKSFTGGHFVCHVWSFRSNVVIARPLQNYFLGSMSKTSANHTALDVSCNKFQKIVIGVFMVHFCHNLTF